LADHPDLTAGELARALGASSRLSHLLRDMEAKAQVVRTAVWRPQQGRPVSLWRLAPPGTVPPPARPRQDLAARRKRDREAQRRRRARARGLVVSPGGVVLPAWPAAALAAPLPPGAACVGADPELFFPEPWQDDAEAKAICARCPIRAQCYELARARGEPWGVWGGENFARLAKGRKAS
jgi:WhiB family redox-sensing transcriptional regulator